MTAVKVATMPIAGRMLISCVMLAAGIVVAEERPTMASVIEASTPSDWRQLEPEKTLYMQLPGGQVVFELAPEFAPAHVANIRKLVRDRYFDGLSVVRSQDNYVVQWGDPASGTDKAKPLGGAAATLAPEFFREALDLPFTLLDSRDPYAPEVGFSHGFPVAREGVDGRAWLVHCYGMLGVGRANPPDSGNGAELYVVTGHSPRHLDRNVTLVGRVLSGMEYLATLPRGSGSLGFYEDESKRVPIASLRFGDELAAADRLQIDIMRTDTDTYQALIESRRYRAEEWYVEPGDAIGLCNVPVPVRAINQGS